MKVTYIPPDEMDAVKCDVATKRAYLVPLFLKYSIWDEENGITCAGLALLLADKIHTVASRFGTVKCLDSGDRVPETACRCLLVHAAESLSSIRLTNAVTQVDRTTILENATTTLEGYSMS